ncbi:hypothetical protein Dimus_017652 [Dionaea muscipula]
MNLMRCLAEASRIKYMMFIDIMLLVSGIHDLKYIMFGIFLNSLDAIGGASWLPETLESKDVTSWNELFDALLIGIHQLGLSGWTPEECSAIGNELRTWKEKGLPEKEALWSSCYLCNLLTVSILTKVDKNSSWVTTIISCYTCHSASE